MRQIASLANPIIKAAARLQKAGERQARGLMIIDGAREISLALKSGLKLETLFYCQALAQAEDKLVVAEDKVIAVTKEVLEKICYKENPDGFLAIVARPDYSLRDIKLSTLPLLIILEKVEKPGNLGAILRTAYAVGADAVIINDNQTDIYNPNVIRASEGYIFKKMVVRAKMEDTVAWLKQHQIKSWAAATNATVNYLEANFCGASALVLGSEADGLTQSWLAAADELIKINMVEGIDSLNVSVAAAVIAFEAARQRAGA